jgi:hypothetical protein
VLPDPIIYFAGPNQHSLCHWMEGQHVLENYENNLGDEGGNIARYRDTFASMAADLGAYMLMTEQRRMEKAGLLSTKKQRGAWTEEKTRRKASAISFAAAHGHGYDWVSHYDDVEGGAEGNYRNWQECKAASIPRLMAVFHQGEPLDLLRQYCKESQYIGLGFQRPINNDLEWLDACFSEIPDGKWVHGFAMTNYLRYPFRSADSKTWLHEVLEIMKVSSGQARTALSFLTQAEICAIVIKKYHREWRRDRWRGTFGVAAGRGQQVDMDELLREIQETA